MTLLDITVDAGRLRFAPVDGRVTFSASVKVGPFRVWLQRWDVARTADHRTLVRSRDGLMGWTAGFASAVHLRSPFVRHPTA